MLALTAVAGAGGRQQILGELSRLRPAAAAVLDEAGDVFRSRWQERESGRWTPDSTGAR